MNSNTKILVTTGADDAIYYLRTLNHVAMPLKFIDRMTSGAAC